MKQLVIIFDKEYYYFYIISSLLRILKKGGEGMDEKLIMNISDILSIHSYRVEALINLLIQRNIFSKEEINNMIDKVMDAEEAKPTADEYVIDELRKKVFIK
jgi:hypothetical protein